MERTPSSANRILNSNWAILSLEIGLSVAFCLLVHFLRPEVLIDDAGFILRYLDHFQEGCFFCFNPTDGPVFGLSGFVHGIVTGGLCLIGMSPETAVLTSNFGGLFLGGVLLMRILRHWEPRPVLWIGAWIAIMLANKAYIYIATTGMETPLHLAIVLGALLAYLKDKPRLMWALLALSAISKLDAVPFILVVAFFYLWPLRKSWFQWKSGPLQPVVWFGIVPIVAWIGFAMLVFGSPLPQSAYAKTFLLFHRSDHWFPFFENYISSGFKMGFFGLFLLLWGGQIIRICLRRSWEDLPRTLPGLAFMGTLILYYFYNPGERMLWYYALPNLLLLTQTLLSLWDLSDFLSSKLRQYGFLLFCLGFIAVNVWKLQGGVQDFNAYLFAVEQERKEIGYYIAGQATESDTLMASHGLTSRPFPGYVIDLTGLNSRLATDFALDRERLLQAHRPHWIVDHGWAADVETILANGYRLDTTFYAITAFGHPEWRIYRRDSLGPLNQPYQAQRIPQELFIVPESTLTEENQVIRFIGNEVGIRLPRTPGKYTLRWGHRLTDAPQKLQIQTLDPVGNWISTEVQIPHTETMDQTHSLYVAPLQHSWQIDSIFPPSINPEIRLKSLTEQPLNLNSFWLEQE